MKRYLYNAIDWLVFAPVVWLLGGNIRGPR